MLTSDDNGKARLWDWNTEQTTQVFSGNQQLKINAVLSPDGRFVLTAGDGILWNAANGAELRKLTEDGVPVEHAAFSPDSRYVFGSIGDHARLWDLQTGPELRRVTSTAASGLHATFAPDGQTILTVENDHVVRLLDTVTNGEKMRLPSSTALDARFSSDGRFVYTSGSAVERWDIANAGNATPIQNIPDFLQQFTLSPDSRSMLLLEGGPTKDVELWSLDTARLVRLFDNVHSPEMFASAVGDTSRIAYMPDGLAIATGNLHGVITLWDVASGAKLRHFETGNGAAVTALSVSPDGLQIAAGYDDGSAQIWDTATGNERVRLVGHQGWVTSAAFSPDSRYVMTATGSASDTGDQHVDVQGTIDAPVAVRLDDGNDSLYARGGSTINGTIDMGAGDDTVLVGDGAVINDTMDGGEGGELNGDTILISDTQVCSEDSAAVALVKTAAAQIATLNPDSDTVTYLGQIYSWVDFEHIASGAHLHSCAPGKITDGRINAYDLGAPDALYCTVGGGVSIWQIDLSGQGAFSFAVTQDQTQAAFAKAIATGLNQVLASGKAGNTLYALSDGHTLAFFASRPAPAGQDVSGDL